MAGTRDSSRTRDPAPRDPPTLGIPPRQERLRYDSVVNRRPSARARVAVACAGIVLVAPAGRGEAADTVSMPYPGIGHVHRVTADQDYHLVRIALTTPRLRPVATAPDQAWSVVSEFARKTGAEIAINANFFTATASCGVTAGGGALWDKVYNGCPMTLAFFGDGSARVAETRASPATPFDPVPALVAAVSGRPALVRNGVLEPRFEGFALVRHPRTAVGLTKGARELLILVADGRRPGALGLTGAETGRILIDAGAVDALNLDGGGSTTLYIEAEGGVQNRPSDGRERVVINHLGFDVR